MESENNEKNELEFLRRGVEDYLYACAQGSPAQQRMQRNRLRRLVGLELREGPVPKSGSRKRRFLAKVANGEAILSRTRNWQKS
jgi:hypothetical protein